MLCLFLRVTGANAAEARHSKGTAPSLALQTATAAGRSVGQSQGSIPKAHPQERSSQDSAWQDEGITCTSLKTGLWEGYRSASLCAHMCKHKPRVSFTLLDSFLLIFKPELAHL